MRQFKAKFLRGASSAEDFPPANFPEVAFAGRSNVGKSSLLNSLMLRKKLAYVSSKPGKTQKINFFLIEDKWLLADLPGFGYAARSKEKRWSWANLLEEYFLTRENLVLVCALIDGRLEPQERDLAFIEWLEHNSIKYLLVMTKSDKLSKKEIEKQKSVFEYIVSECEFCVEVLPYSSKTGMGRDSLFAIVKRECS